MNLAAVVLTAHLACCAPGQYQVALSAVPPGYQPVTVVHTTDLYYPAWDFDDVNDATVWYAMVRGGYADLKGIVCDEPFSHSRGDGRAWSGVYRLATGLDVPYYDGLNDALASQTDNGDSQAAQWRAGRDRILTVLGAAPDHSVVLTAVGSLRDIAAASNKNPSLFAQKVKAVYTSGGGQGSGTFDANWGSDRNAVRRLLNQGVPLHVAFCGASSAGNDGSLWMMDLDERMAVTDATNPALSQIMYWAYYGSQDGGFRYKHYQLDTQRYAAFGLSKLDPSPWGGLNRPPLPASISDSAVMADPAVFFDEPMNKDYAREGFYVTVSDEVRNPPVGSDGSPAPFGAKGMWSTVCFLDAVGLRVFRGVGDPTRIQLAFQDDLGPGWQRVLGFDPVTYTFSSDRMYYAPSSEEDAEMHVFHWYTAGSQEYQDIMNAVERALVGTLLFRPGDADGDGDVDFADYQTLEINFGSAGATWRMGDFDLDGDVDFADYQVLEGNFGTAIPEPVALLWLAIGAVLLGRRQRG